MAEGQNHFGFFDYIAVAGTLLLSLLIGLYFAFVGKQSKDELLVGGRKMNVFPVAASMMVTYFSAISIIGYPSEIYTYGIQIFFMQLLGIICIPLSAFIFVRVFFDMKLTSVYEYLEHRFDSTWVRWMASFTFILQISLLNGVFLYAPAIALETIVGLPAWISMTVIGLIGTAYTSVGGLKAVIWTDVFQFFMIMFGLFSIVTKGFIKAGGISNAFSVAAEKGRLSLLDFTIDPFMRHNTLNLVLGYGFTITTVYGTNQPLVQRYSSLPTLSGAVKSLCLVLPLKLFANTVVMLTGVSLVATYVGCCPILRGDIKKADALIPHFVVEELAFIPGMLGIFTSCIFSAVLSSVSSTLNSLAAVTWEDFLSKASYFKRMSNRGQAQTTIYLVCVYGILSILIAFVAQHQGAIFEVTMKAVGATGGPLSGIFLTGLFIPFMNKYGALAGMFTGLASMMLVAIKSLALGHIYVMYPHLPTDIDDCPAEMNVTMFTTAAPKKLPRPEEFDYPEKIFTLSYILFPFLGSMITIFVGCFVSILTGGLSGKEKVDEKYFHPWIRGTWFVERFVKKPQKTSLFTEMKPLNSPISSSKEYEFTDIKHVT